MRTRNVVTSGPAGGEDPGQFADLIPGLIPGWSPGLIGAGCQAISACNVTAPI